MEEEDTTSSTGESSDTQESTQADEAPRMVPLSALEEERTKRQASAAKYDALVAAQLEASTAAAEEQGEYKRLYEEMKATREAEQSELSGFKSREVSRLEAVAEANTTAFESLSEAARELIDMTAPPDSVALMLKKVTAFASLGKPGVSVGTIAAGSKLSGETTYPPDVVAAATKHGKTPEWWQSNVIDKLKKKT